MTAAILKKTAYLFALGTVIVSLTASTLFAQAGVTLGGTFVPKEKMVVFILIGNSAMSGRDLARDLSTVPTAWSYRIPNPDRSSNDDIVSTLYKWNLAAPPLHIDVGSTGKQDPGSPFIKKIAQKYEGTGYYFGVVQISGSAYLISTFQRGQKRYDTIVNNVLRLKNNVTIVAIISMFNLVEMEKTATEVGAYLTNTTTTVSQMRADLGMSNLPYIHSGYPVLAKGIYDTSNALPRQILPLIKQIPDKIANSCVIPTDGLTIYQDKYTSHYDSAGCANWGKRVVDTVVARKIVQINSRNRPLSFSARSIRESSPCAVFIADGKVPASLSRDMGAAGLFSLDGKRVMAFRQGAGHSAGALRIRPGIYVAERE